MLERALVLTAAMVACAPSRDRAPLASNSFDASPDVDNTTAGPDADGADTEVVDSLPSTWCSAISAADFCADFDDGVVPPAGASMATYADVTLSKRARSAPWGARAQAPASTEPMGGVTYSPIPSFIRVDLPRGGSNLTFEADIWIAQPAFRPPDSSTGDPGDNGGIQLLHLQSFELHFQLELRRSAIEWGLMRAERNSGGGLTHFHVADRTMPLPSFGTWIHLSVVHTATSIVVKLGSQTSEARELPRPSLAGSDTLLLFGARGWSGSPPADVSYDNVTLTVRP